MDSNLQLSLLWLFSNQIGQVMDTVGVILITILALSAFATRSIERST